VDGLRLTSEWLLVVSLLVLAVALASVFLRRRLIARGKPLTVCALRESGDRRWRFGLARYGSTGVEWYPLEGLSVRPARRWARAQLDIGASESLETGERPEILIPEAMRVPCSCQDVSFEIALAQAPYTALRSWVESSPPGRNVDVA